MSGNQKIIEISDNVYRLGPLGDPPVLCSYLIESNGKASIVDCGPESVVDELADLVSECGFSSKEVENLLLTHIHIDHAGGTARFLERFVDARVHVPTRGLKHLIDPSALNSSARLILGPELFDYWGESRPVPESKIRPMDNQGTVDLNSYKIKYIEARGHAPHHDVLLIEQSNILFAADSLGIRVEEIEGFRSPTTPPPSFNLDQQFRDFEMIQKLEPKLICLAHFISLIPTRTFYDETIKVYTDWERIIRRYLSNNRIKGIDLDEKDVDEIFASLAQEYQAYNEAPPSLRHQLKRVDIRGLSQWFDFKAERTF